MVWEVIRLAIFFGAFVIGLIIVEQLMPSVASNSLRFQTRQCVVERLGLVQHELFERNQRLLKK